jgi:predicted Zn-dependent protease
VLWAETEYQLQKAQERFTKVLTNRQVKVEEEDLSGDFSPSDSHTYTEEVSVSHIDEGHWRPIIKAAAEYFTGFPFVHDSRVWLASNDKATIMVNSEGNRLHHGNHYIRLGLNISGMADDGMELDRGEIFSVSSIDHLPDREVVMQTAERLVEELQALIDAPLVEPYIGPAILCNRASGVFFHEIFGHRIEGHRQKSESEGQTFTKKLNEQILPEFISVYDDPTLARFGDTDLRGYYQFDDEGVKSQRLTVVDKGVLKNFLTSRSPIENFPRSNGHGRRQYGYDIVSRMGNTIIESEKRVTYERLREMLIEECRKQDKPYGLIFNDISGGFTMTGRRGPQAFKVLPLYVYRVYADGRPNEVVRGVDIVGTPLTCFSKILVTADDDAVFNGTCGAESGGVPVSAVSPSLLVSEIEVEKRYKQQEKPPILAPPKHE